MTELNSLSASHVLDLGCQPVVYYRQDQGEDANGALHHSSVLMNRSIPTQVCSCTWK